MLGISKTDPKQKNSTPRITLAARSVTRLGFITQRASHVLFNVDGWHLQRLICHCGCSPAHPARTGCAATVQYLAGILKSTWILKSRHCSGLAIRHAERMMLSIGRGSLVALGIDCESPRYHSAPVPGRGLDR